MDKARQATDKKLKTMEKHLERTYSTATKELTEKWNKYMRRGEKRLKGLYEAFEKESNPIAKAEAKKVYQNAVKVYTLENKWYKDMIAQTTKQLANVNQTALKYINGNMDLIYVMNYNEAENAIKDMGVHFDIINEDVVKRRIKEGKIVSHKKQLDIPKDRRWNAKKLNSSVLQGLIQGESMQEISKRIYPIVDSNRASAIRNARTMVTQSENSGRLDSYKQLEDNGVILKKEWMATPDDRTRESHIDLDGEQQNINDEFSNGLMYPADPNGDASEVWQCRCTMIVDIVGFKGKNGKINYVKTPKSDTMHDGQMKEEKERRKNE